MVVVFFQHGRKRQEGPLTRFLCCFQDCLQGSLCEELYSTGRAERQLNKTRQLLTK